MSSHDVKLTEMQNNNYTRHVGPVLEQVHLKCSEEDDRSFLVPAVQPISELPNRETSIPVVRRQVWETPDKPPALRTPRRVYLIDSTGDVFDDALEDIINSAVIGVKLEGPSIKRGGVLPSLSIATRDNVYIFDIIQLGTKAFKFGLGHVFKNAAIIKVFHDVRMSSDMLYHDYKVELVNVFDTAVADSVIFASNHVQGLKPNFIRSYQAVCMEYLGVPGNALFFHLQRTNRFEKDNKAFWEQPMGRFKTLAFLRNCMYLVPLHHVCQAALLHHVHSGVRSFLGQIRDVGGYEAEILAEKAESNKLPIPWEWAEQLPSPVSGTESLETEGLRVQEDTVTQNVGDYIPHNIYRE